MKDKMKKVWKFIKENKWAVIVTSGGLLLGGVCLHKGLTYKSVLSPLAKNDQITKLPVNLGVGVMTDAYVYKNGVVELWMDNLDIDDLGKLGEGIVNNIPEIPENAKVWTLMTIHKET